MKADSTLLHLGVGYVNAQVTKFQFPQVDNFDQVSQLGLTGAIVQGAALTLASVDTGVTAKAKVDDNGFFQFLQLAPGRYELNAAAAGFRKADIKDIAVLLDQIVSYDVRLEIGQVTETLEV